MKLQNTSIITFISLILLSFNSYSEGLSDKISACTLALNKGDAVTALNRADEALKLNPTNRDALLCQGRALGAQGKYNEALSALQQAENQSKEPFDKVISNLLIGNLQKENQKNVEAIASYEKSLGICKTEKNDKFARISHNLIGEAHAQNKDYNAALTSYTAGSGLAMNDNERADSYERLAATYKALGQYDAAIEYQLKGMLMQKKAGTLDQYANASLELGQIYILARDYPGAEKTLSKFLQFAKENGGAYYEAKASLYLAQSKAASGDLTSAKTLLADARNIAKNVGDKDLMGEIEATGKNLEK